MSTIETFLEDTRRSFLNILEGGKYDLANNQIYVVILNTTMQCCGVTQKEMGSVLQVSPSLISLWSRGIRNPPTARRTKDIERICAHLRHLLGEKTSAPA